jgi:hypothetical protein
MNLPRLRYDAVTACVRREFGKCSVDRAPVSGGSDKKIHRFMRCF